MIETDAPPTDRSSIEFFQRERFLSIAAALFREVAVAKLIREAQDGSIPCAQIAILADQHEGAFRRMLSRRLDDQS